MQSPTGNSKFLTLLQPHILKSCSYYQILLANWLIPVMMPAVAPVVTMPPISMPVTGVLLPVLYAAGS